MNAANRERATAILHTDIELKNHAGAAWFSAYAADITFSYNAKSCLFIPRIEKIRYQDRHGGTVALCENKADNKQSLCFILLAGGIERSICFKSKAWNLICGKAENCGRTAAQVKQKSGETAENPARPSGARAW